MPTEQRLPDDLVRRFKQIVPVGERSAFVRQLLEHALPSVDGDNDPQYLAALVVEQDTTLGEKMAEWEATTSAMVGSRPLSPIGTGEWRRTRGRSVLDRSGGLGPIRLEASKSRRRCLLLPATVPSICLRVSAREDQPAFNWPPQEYASSVASDRTSETSRSLSRQIVHPAHSQNRAGSRQRP